MVAYVTYAEKFHWTPEQVDQLTTGQDDWILPILSAIEDQRSYNEKKAIEAGERKAEAKRRRGFK
jgi:hypothetical protein